MHQKVGEKKTEIKFDCISGSDGGYFLTKSEVPESYKSLYKKMRALYNLEEFTCLKFDKIDSFLTIFTYSFKEKPSSENPDEVCSGMEKEDKFNAIGFSPADQFTKPKKHSH
ncbi:Hypothetical predicted protein [Paramuricea clavata]|uniref:Uncharacterized protein n=1 Tax=Paramuricea clavata TaxID=317549 RepID=A0A6S7FZ36_PARCT|nr:Hypothetical predicted protein [Paramuricea clavata]